MGKGRTGGGKGKGGRRKGLRKLRGKDWSRRQ